MTLFKQVALVVSLVFVLLVAINTFGDFKRSGEYLEGQLQTAAQDMTTTLGIALSNLEVSGQQPGADVAAYETLFNAVFDSGYYSSIELVSPDGKIIHRKDRMVEIQGVPDWFVSMIPLWPATGSTEVMRGWTPLGTLRLTLHPGYVYSSLYQNLKATFTWLLVLFFFGLLILWLLLHQLLKPLAMVRQQAEAIHENKFVQQKNLPRTVELRRVVEAMNRMVEKVHIVFDDQESTLLRYQKLLYEDEVTGMGNRQYFISELERSVSEEHGFHGSMAVIRVHHLEFIKTHFGYKKYEQVLNVLARVLKEETNLHSNEQSARLAENEFALLASVSGLTITERLEDIFEDFRADENILDIQTDVWLTAGVTSVEVGRQISQLLSESDYALTQAESRGPYSINETSSSGIQLPQGKMKWRNWLEKSIEEGKLYLVKQAVKDVLGNDVHYEIFVRLKNDDGQTVAAGMFIPMANALGMGEAIDRNVFSLVKKNTTEQGDVPLALNLSVSVFSSADALVEFGQLIKFYQSASTMLCVEASHHILERYPSMCDEIAELVRNAGLEFGIDNLNLGYSLQVLQTLRPDYVKINARAIHDMTSGDVPTAYQALRTLTKAMDIRLIAVGVDSQEMYDHLVELGIDTMQGNLLSPTEEIL